MKKGSKSALFYGILAGLHMIGVSLSVLFEVDLMLFVLGMPWSFAEALLSPLIAHMGSGQGLSTTQLIPPIINFLIILFVAIRKKLVAEGLLTTGPQ